MMNYLTLVYAAVRRLYSLIFPFRMRELNSRELIYYNTKKYDNLRCDFEYELVNKNFKEFSNRIEEEYVGVVNEPCYKDPYHGWIITEKKHEIIQASIPYANWKQTWAKHPIPNRFDYHFKKHKSEFFEEAISCDMIYHYGNNYMHFYHSFIAQLALLEKKGVKLDKPVVIPVELYNTKFFRDALECFPKLKQINFIVSDEQVIYFDKVYFSKVNPYTKKVYPLVLDFLNIRNIKRSEKNIFISRPTSRYRSFSNYSEICEIVNQYGFIEIFPENLTLVQQIELFQTAKNIFAIHGAGIANILFAYPNKVNLFEVFSCNHILPGYYNMVFEMGTEYECMLGSVEDENGNFHLDPVVFRLKFENWLNAIK